MPDDAPATPPDQKLQPPRARTKYELLVALRKHSGDREAAAKELQIAYGTLSDRISNDPQLRQLYGKNQWADSPKPPTELDVMQRSKGDLPLPTNIPEDEKKSVAEALQLVSLVSPEDTKRLIRGLEAFDFSEASLEKIRSLGKLAENTGRFIAVSLEKTHQNYVVQQFGLMELAANIRKRLMVPKGGDDYVSDEETRAFLHKNYVEMVRESGRGVERMLQVAEVITRMLESASSKTKAVQTKKGWKKVTATEAQNGQAGQ